MYYGLQHETKLSFHIENKLHSIILNTYQCIHCKMFSCLKKISASKLTGENS